MAILPFLHFTVFLLTIIIACYVLYRNHHSAVNRLASVIFLCMGFWNLTQVFSHNPLLDYDTALLWTRLSVFGFVPFIGFYVLFILHLTGNTRVANSKAIIILAFFIPLIFIYSELIHGAIFNDISFTKFGWRFKLSESVVPFIFYIYFVVCMIYCKKLLVTFYRSTEDKNKRNQTLVLFITSIPPIVYGLYTDIICPRLGYVNSFTETGNISVVIWLVGLLFATVKYRLFEFTPAIAAENIINIMSDALFMVRSDGTVFHVNSTASELVKDHGRMIIDKPFASLFDGSDREIKDFLSDKKRKNIEGELMTQDGTKVPVAISSSTIKENTGEELGYVFLVRDITEQKKNKEKLEMLVEQRTSDLLAAKEKAVESDKLKSAFLANMSHEIRTPMNAIIGFSDFLKDNVSDNERDVCINQIQDNGQLLLTLIDDILDLAKIESGQVSIKSQMVSINQIISEVFITFKETLIDGTNKVKLVMDIPSYSTIVNTDPIRLKQILNNLLRNAIKFTNIGHIKIGYSSKSKDDLLFYVEDTGIGIPEEQLSNIFERFYKIEEKNQGKLYSGTGLGLAISKQLVNLLNGDIWVESELGKGSTFYFTIPKLEVDDYISIKEKEMYKKNKAENRSVLVVEDEESAYLILKKYLKRMNFDCIHAEDGMKAIELAKVNNFDLVLMDLKLPKLDGYNAYKEILKINKDVPVIAQTAFTGENERKKCLAYGFRDIINKPITYKKLYKSLEKYIED